MKLIFTFLLCKHMRLLTVICLLFATNGAIAQTTATEDFESEGATGSGTATAFSAGGINFLASGRFVLGGASNTNLGANNSRYFLHTGLAGGQTAGTITITTASTSFKINSFAAYAASDVMGNSPTSGTITFTGNLAAGGTATGTAFIPVGGGNGVVNGITISGALAGQYVTSVTVTMPGGIQYLELDDFNFTTQAVVSNQFSISDASVSEGNSGARALTFTVTRTSNAAASSVQVQSANNTATAPGDYVAFPLTTLNFISGGALTQTATVTINGDVTIEGNETFFMNLINPTGGVILDAQGVGTILEDDEVAETFEDETVNSLTFSQSGFNFSSTGALLVSRGNNVGSGGGTSSALDTRVGNGGSTGNVGSFSITNAGTSFNITSIQVWTSNDDGLNGTTAPVTVTFTGTKADGSGTVSYAAPIAAMSGYAFQTVSFAGTSLANVQLISISVTLGTGANYIALDNFKFGTSSINATQLSINDVSVLEGTGGGTTTATFTVSRSNNTTAFTVNLASSDGTATAGSDYVAYPSTTLSFAAGGALSQTVNVTVLHDAALESSETFNMTLSGATNGALYLKPVGIGKILDDDKVIETFDNETTNATTFSENTFTFAATNRLKVNISQNSGSGSSTGYLTAGISSTGGIVGKISITSPNKAFKLLQLDAWTGNGNPTINFASGPVTFTGTLYGGGTVTTTKTITPTSNTGTGWQQNITFTGTPLDNVLLTELEFSVGGTLTTVEIDNFHYTVINTSPYTEVTDASNNTVTNGGAASAGNNTDFGTVCTSASVSKIFTIKNTGGVSLIFSGSPLAVLGGANAGQFSITSQPAATVAANGSTTFTVSYSPTAGGTHNATITLTSNDAANSPYVINIKGTANHVSLTIGTQPTASTTSCTGSSVSFTATAIGGGTLSYQWYKGTTPLTNGASGTGSVYSGTTTTTLTIANITASDNATNYYATIKNSCATVTSANASLTAVSPPVVTSPTVTQPTCAVPTGTIEVNVTGSGTLEYSKDGVNWQTGNTFSELPAPGNYTISVRIQGLSGCVSTYSGNPVVINAAPSASTVAAPTDLACYQTATFNTATCSWDITGTQPTQPASVNCWDNYQFNTTLCTWENAGTQPNEPVKVNCWDDYQFNTTTCTWENAGHKPTRPATACYQTATFNTETCQWEVTGTQPAEPTVACYQTARFSTTTCQWLITGEQPARPTTECYQTATFNTISCEWEVTGEQPARPTTACYQTAIFNTETCEWDVTGTQPTQPASVNCWDNYQFNTTSCTWVNTGVPSGGEVSPCFSAALLSRTVNADNTTTFTYRVCGKGCATALSQVAFITAGNTNIVVSPSNKSTYTTANYSYKVSLPVANDKNGTIWGIGYAVVIKGKQQGIKNIGECDNFTFTLSGNRTEADIAVIEFKAGKTVTRQIAPSCQSGATVANRVTLQNRVADQTIIADLNVKAYPNPFTDKVRFTIKSPKAGRATLEVYNILGQKVGVPFEGQLNANETRTVEYTAPVNNRANLIYMLRMNGKQVSGKLVNIK